jgi:uncharacterized membrane protein (UPF0127 family)
MAISRVENIPGDYRLPASGGTLRAMAPPPNFLRPLIHAPDARWALRISGRDAALATTVEPAFDSARRNRGLLGRDGLPARTALIIAPSNAVHTFQMRFPIDIVFAARDGRVLKIRSAVPKGRIAFAWGGFAVIEMAAGEATRAGLQTGDVLALSPNGQ